MKKLMIVLASWLLLLDAVAANTNVNPHCLRGDDAISPKDLCFDLNDNGQLTLYPEAQYPKMTNGRSFITTPLPLSLTVEGQWTFLDTDDPGWIIHTDNLQRGEQLFFRAWGSLRVWQPASAPLVETWSTETEGGEKIRFFGDVPASVLLSDDDALKAFYQQGTLVSGSGFTGPLAAKLGQINQDGAELHEHLQFCLEDRNGNCTLEKERRTELQVKPPIPFPVPVVVWSNTIERHGEPSPGAYMLEFQVVAKSDSEQDIHQASAPFGIVFNYRLDDDEFKRAIAALQTVEDSDDDEAPDQAAGILLLYEQ